MPTITTPVSTSRNTGIKKTTEPSIDFLRSMITINSSVAAAGSSIADATALPAAGTGVAGGFTPVTASDGTKGVILPASFAGAVCIVQNTVASVLKVYPATSAGTINGGSAGAALSQAASCPAIYICKDNSDTWISIPKVPS